MTSIYNSGGYTILENSNGTKRTYPSGTIRYFLSSGRYIFYDINDTHILEGDFENFSDEDGSLFSSDLEFQSYLSNLVSSSFGTSILFFEEQASLADGAEIDSGFIDFGSYGKQQLTIKANVSGVTFRQTLKGSSSGAEEVVSVPLSLANQTFNVVIRNRFQRIQIQNNTGSTITDVSLEIKGYRDGSDGFSVVPLSSTLVPQSQAGLTRSVISGQSVGSTSATDQFRNVSVNQANAILTADFGTEVARNLIANYEIDKKFGRNSDIDSSTTPEDVWNGGGEYTGFNCTQAETLEFFSSSANDTGSLLSSGTATSESSTNLIDAGADFVADGVAVGDLVINDTQKFHGIVSAVTATSLTVQRFLLDTSEMAGIIEAGDSYRIATATSTGAAVCKYSSMLDSNYDSFSEYVIMNGITAVDSVGTYLRQSRGKVILAGSSNTNVGEITGRQKTTTANVTMVMPATSGQTAICCDTVPRGETWIIKELNVQISRLNGSAGSANCRFQTRRIGEAFQTRRFPAVSTGQDYIIVDIGGINLPEFTDVKWNVQSVSDNNTVVSAEFEYYKITN